MPLAALCVPTVVSAPPTCALSQHLTNAVCLLCAPPLFFYITRFWGARCSWGKIRWKSELEALKAGRAMPILSSPRENLSCGSVLASFAPAGSKMWINPDWGSPFCCFCSVGLNLSLCYSLQSRSMSSVLATLLSLLLTFPPLPFLLCFFSLTLPSGKVTQWLTGIERHLSSTPKIKGCLPHCSPFDTPLEYNIWWSE